MPHSSNLLWKDIEQIVSGISRTMLRELILGEEAYQDLLEAYQYAGGTDQAFANLLFNTTADAGQVAQVTDARQALVAVHRLYELMTNNAVAQADYAADLRRMS